MVSISDLVKLLDQVPLWKRLTGLPARVEALEARVQALEARLAERPKGDACPNCGGAMRITGEKPHPTFGRHGARLRSLTCAECGFTTEKTIKPGEV